MSDTGLIEATSGTYRSRVDGTLVLQVEIQPYHAKAAMELLAMPGTPIVLAALKNAAASGVPSGDAGDSTLERGGKAPDAAAPKRAHPIVEWLALRCKEPEFQHWLNANQSRVSVIGEASAAETIRLLCRVSSRSEIPDDPFAKRAFDEIRKKYEAHLKTQGTA